MADTSILINQDDIDSVIASLELVKTELISSLKQLRVDHQDLYSDWQGKCADGYILAAVTLEESYGKVISNLSSSIEDLRNAAAEFFSIDDQAAVEVNKPK